jgi:hypothetical protein
MRDEYINEIGPFMGVKIIFLADFLWSFWVGRFGKDGSPVGGTVVTITAKNRRRVRKRFLRGYSVGIERGFSIHIVVNRVFTFNKRRVLLVVSNFIFFTGFFEFFGGAVKSALFTFFPPS